MLRLVAAAGVESARTYLESPSIIARSASGSCIGTRIVGREAWPAIATTGADFEMVLEHDLVAFPSYPYEWTPGMLRDAGMLTLDIAKELVREGANLKDATPLNILFRSTRPVFIDALSVERRDLSDPVWFAYGQFVRTFILPLVASRDLRWTLRRSFYGARDGIDPTELYECMGWTERLRSPTRGAVTGPVLIGKTGLLSSVPSPEKRRTEPRRAAFVLERILDQLTSSLLKAAPRQRESEWTGYVDPSVHPTEYHQVRQSLVASVLDAHRPKRVLDVGTNDGAFAVLASQKGAEVVAIDRDEAVVDQTFRRLATTNANVLPLVVDLTDPTPAMGWLNAERRSFLERSAGKFDAVLCLAVLHHMVVGDGLQLRDVFSLLGQLSTDLVIAEFVPASDEWCRRLARGRPITEERWSERAFETEAERLFTIESRHTEGLRGRTLYMLRRRGAAHAAE
jgi:SAM-dependent methyltransferase